MNVAAAKAVVGKLIRRLQVRVLPGVRSSGCFTRCNDELRKRTEETGDVAEWLGKGLQNPVRRFESARHLIKMPRVRRTYGAFLHWWVDENR